MIIRLVRIARIARVVQALSRDSRTKDNGMLLWRVLGNTSQQMGLLLMWFGIASFVFGKINNHFKIKFFQTL